ncbi:GTPase HflX [Fournierella massiliensis]|nr:GTPase HflX [Fournierella massiliensis]MCF2556992.1 GTPase HflX [Fournierella massiliensis]
MAEKILPENQQPFTRILLLALDLGQYDMERSLEELTALAQANRMEVVAQIVQKRDAPETGTVLGAGKLEEARLYAMNLEAEAAVFDGELTGSQIRNLSDALGIEVLDRTMLILEIFRSRAVTGEGKLQTELALLRYRLPRLQGLGQALSRQGGGGGGTAGARRGSGESQLELDRRHVRHRIESLEEKLREMEKRRGENRRARQKSGVPVVALVGYTNVGKSSLMNVLCGEGTVLAKDMLFATLDPTARQLSLPSGLNVILVDTVGFVSRLPHHLVRAFRSTLEEAAFADVIVMVADATDPAREEQLAVTEQVLNDLDCRDIPRLVVYNKADRAGAVAFDPSVLLTSARTGRGLDQLLKALDEKLGSRVRRVKVLLPYDKLSLLDVFRREGSVISEEYQAEGVAVEGILPADRLHLVQEYLETL